MTLDPKVLAELERLVLVYRSEAGVNCRPCDCHMCTNGRRLALMMVDHAPALLAAAREVEELSDAVERFRAMAFLPRGTSPSDIADHYNTVLRSYGYPEDKSAAMNALTEGDRDGK